MTFIIYGEFDQVLLDSIKLKKYVEFMANPKVEHSTFAQCLRSG
jgi:hypothetical protein